jgi:hypothetical protein
VAQQVVDPGAGMDPDRILAESTRAARRGVLALSLAPITCDASPNITMNPTPASLRSADAGYRGR